MIDKVQKIRQEVEKLKSNLIHGACASQIAMETRCKEEAYDEVISLLDSLQEESASEELIDVAKQYVKEHVIGIDKFTFSIATDMFISGAKWQKEQDKETIELAEDHAMLAGMNKMEEQIMNKAKSGIGDKDNYIKFEDDTWLDLDPTMKLKPAFDVKEGEKVKVLIIKEV